MPLASKIAAGFLVSYVFLVAFLVWLPNYGKSVFEEDGAPLEEIPHRLSRLPLRYHILSGTQSR
jgi:hypothetical protein